MLRSWFRQPHRRYTRPAPRGSRPPRARLRLENLEDRCLMAGNVTITAVTIPQAVEGQPSDPALTADFTDSAGVAANQLTATVDYGDGTRVQALQLNGHTFQLQHRYKKAGKFHVTVQVRDDRGTVGTDSFVVNVSKKGPSHQAAHHRR